MLKCLSWNRQHWKCAKELFSMWDVVWEATRCIFRKKGLEVTGIDISEASVEIAKKEDFPRRKFRISIKLKTAGLIPCCS